MKHQAYFLRELKVKKIKCRLLQFLARVQEELLYYPCVGGGIGVSKM